jgi:hypothetical protein
VTGLAKRRCHFGVVWKMKKEEKKGKMPNSKYWKTTVEGKLTQFREDSEKKRHEKSVKKINIGRDP